MNKRVILALAGVVVVAVVIAVWVSSGQRGGAGSAEGSLPSDATASPDGTRPALPTLPTLPAVPVEPAPADPATPAPANTVGAARLAEALPEGVLAFGVIPRPAALLEAAAAMGLRAVWGQVDREIPRDLRALLAVGPGRGTLDAATYQRRGVDLEAPLVVAVLREGIALSVGITNQAAFTAFLESIEEAWLPWRPETAVVTLEDRLWRRAHYPNFPTIARVDETRAVVMFAVDDRDWPGDGSAQDRLRSLARRVAKRGPGSVFPLEAAAAAAAKHHLAFGYVSGSVASLPFPDARRYARLIAEVASDLQGAAASVALTDGELRLAVELQLRPKSRLLAPFVGQQRGVARPGRIAGPPLAGLHGRIDLAPAIQALDAYLALDRRVRDDYEEALGELRRVLGVDVRRDIYANLTGEAGVFVFTPPDPRRAPPVLGWVGVTDDAAANQTLAAVHAGAQRFVRDLVARYPSGLDDLRPGHFATRAEGTATLYVMPMGRRAELIAAVGAGAAWFSQTIERVRGALSAAAPRASEGVAASALASSAPIVGFVDGAAWFEAYGALMDREMRGHEDAARLLRQLTGARLEVTPVDTSLRLEVIVSMRLGR